MLTKMFEGVRQELQTPSAVRDAGLICLLTILAYLPAVHGDFIWDDWQLFIVKNPMLRDWQGLYNIWFSTKSADYYPLAYTSFWLDWHIWELEPTGYHLVNILLHAASSVLLWRVLKRLRIPGGWLAAMLFALHPVNVESVAWIAERKNTLSFLFYVGAGLSYLHFLGRGQKTKYALALILFCCALLAKTGAVMLPVVLLGFSWWLRGRLTARDGLLCAPFFAAALLFGLFTVWYHCLLPDGAPARTDTLLSRLAGAGWCVWFYLGKVVFPFRLSFVYPRWEIDTASAATYVPVLLLALLFLATLAHHRQPYGRAVLAAMGYYVAGIFPVLGFVNIVYMRFSFVADHWQYYAIIGIIALVVGGAHSLCLRMKLKKPAVRIVAACLVGGMFVLCLRRAAVFENEVSLFEDSTKKNPEAWLAHINIGKIYTMAGRPEQALPHFDAAVRANPELDLAHLNRGITRVAIRKDLAGAIDDFNNVIRLNPRDAKAYYYRGIARLLLGTNMVGAIRDFDMKIRSDPTHSDAYAYRANVRMRSGDTSGAVLDLAEAFRHASPDWPKRPSIGNVVEKKYRGWLTHISAGEDAERKERFEEALAHYDAAARSNPELALSHFKKGLMRVRQGRNMKEAQKDFDAAILIRPAYPEALFYRARVRMDLKDLRGAILDLAKAVDVAPPDWIFRPAIESLLRDVGYPPEARNEGVRNGLN